ncbi:hypothetical protein L195_g012027, partial [Trifolium pratense]
DDENQINDAEEAENVNEAKEMEYAYMNVMKVMIYGLVMSIKDAIHGQIPQMSIKEVLLDKVGMLGMLDKVVVTPLGHIPSGDMSEMIGFHVIANTKS